ncbi:MAG: hypothetical protein QME76_02070 [Bacillota bacterium]|nr:hypothetical protein [Bacillota bacterium]
MQIIRDSMAGLIKLVVFEDRVLLDGGVTPEEAAGYLERAREALLVSAPKSNSTGTA